MPAEFQKQQAPQAIPPRTWLIKLKTSTFLNQLHILFRCFWKSKQISGLQFSTKDYVCAERMGKKNHDETIFDKDLILQRVEGERSKKKR